MSQEKDTKTEVVVLGPDDPDLLRIGIGVFNPRGLKLLEQDSSGRNTNENPKKISIVK